MTTAERVARIRFPRGFHSRPMAEFINRARTFEAAVRVSYLGDREDGGRVLEGLDGKHAKGREVDGKSIFGLMNLERFARRGDRLWIEAEGEDAEEAVEALALYLEKGLDHAELQRLMDLRDRIDRLLERAEQYRDARQEMRRQIRMARTSADKLEELLELET